MSQTLTHTDSIEQEEQDRKKSQKKQKSRRPANTAFRQQRLKAWQPILTPKTVLPIFFAVGIIFAPIGGLLLWASAGVQELIIDYTDCSTAESEFSQIPDDKVSASFSSSNSTARPQWKRVEESRRPPYSAVNVSDTSVCTLQFSIPNDINPPVYMYYRLTNFYQNHRRYVSSLDTSQLRGSALDNDTIDGSACNPLKLAHNGKAIYPCGLIANSIFNDTLWSPILTTESGGDGPSEYRMTNESIAWGSDSQLYKRTDYQPENIWPPPNWERRYPDGYTRDGPGQIPDLSTYEEFHVWMRTAGLPTFSKLALRNDNDVLRAGIYQMEIYDYFPTSEYGGTKSILLSTRTVLGGKNSFLGIAYVVVAGICVVVGVVFTLAHLIKPRRLGDHTYLSWNNADLPPSTATTTGRDTRPGTQGA